MLPCPMTSARSEIAMAIVSFCSMSSTEMPRSLSFCRYSPTSSTILGARPSVGSSMMIRSGSPISVRHRVSICCSPPESTPASVCCLSCNRGNIVYMSSNAQRPVCVAVFGHVTDPQMGDLVGFHAECVPAFPVHRAGALDHAHDRLGRGRAARSVAAEQRDDLARTHGELDTMQHMALAIERVEVFDCQHQRAPTCASATWEPR